MSYALYVSQPCKLYHETRPRSTAECRARCADPTGESEVVWTWSSARATFWSGAKHTPTYPPPETTSAIASIVVYASPRAHASCFCYSVPGTLRPEGIHGTIHTSSARARQSVSNVGWLLLLLLGFSSAAMMSTPYSTYNAALRTPPSRCTWVAQTVGFQVWSS
jgi:hypothetical protein